jgi:hypothetical protein
MINARIEEVGDINSNYPYLEVFLHGDKSPFLEISISDAKELSFKFYVSSRDIFITLEDWEYILSAAKEYFPRVLKNEDDFLTFTEI